MALGEGLLVGLVSKRGWRGRQVWRGAVSLHFPTCSAIVCADRPSPNCGCIYGGVPKVVASLLHAKFQFRLQWVKNDYKLE